MRQRTRVVIGALLVGLLAAVPALPGPTAVAAPTTRVAQPFTLTLVEGHLTLRGAEPFALANPTTISGSVDSGDGGTGAITGASFSTPTVSITQEITSPVVATVFVDAVFSQVSPGVGSIDADGAVLVQTALRVDLHIEVVGIVSDCVSTPIALNLESTVPYDPDTGLVTLSDPDFTIPAVPIGGSCSSLIGPEVNDLLAGAGHALSLTLQGAVELPPPAGCPTATHLSVAPGAGSRLGSEVTLTARVAEAADAAGVPECADAPAHPAGFVELRDGTRVLGTVALVDGEASLVTGALPAGHRDLSARYRGEPPFSASTSEGTSYRVAATPGIVTDLPEHVQIGGGAVPFTVEVVNTDLGFALDRARLDISLVRSEGIAAFTADRLLVEYHDGSGWVAVPLATPASRQLVGPVGAPFALDVGASRSVPMRLTLQPGATAMLPGPLGVTLELVELDPAVAPDPAPVLAPNPAAATATTVAVTMVEATRRPTTIGFRIQQLGPPVLPQVVRQGYTVQIPGVSLGSPGLSGVPLSGHVEVLLDGQPVGARRATSPATPLPEGYLEGVPLWGSIGSVGSLNVRLPADLPIGDHQISLRYSGDTLFLPSVSAVAAITVLPAVGPLFECQAPLGLVSARFSFHVQAVGSTATYAAPGAEVALRPFAVHLFGDRGPAGRSVFTTYGGNPVSVGEGRLSGISFGIGPDGAGTAAGLTYAGTLMNSPDPANPDATVTFQGASAAVTVDGSPGDVVPVTLDSISLFYTEQGLTPASLFLCEPVGDPITLGQVTLVGTALSVSPAEHVRAGDEVGLSVQVHPVGRPGNVVFSDGGTTIGVVPVTEDGTASMRWTATEGSRSLTARFLGGLAVLSTADEVSVDVGPTHECAAFAVAGAGAVVRLAYMELLGRCPDPGGFAHWTGRLDGGLSAEAFARQIASSTEALGRVVDDGYRTMLDREASAADRSWWAGRLRGHGRYDQLLADLAASPEFWVAAGSSGAGFVDRVYERILGRPAADADRAYWAGRLDRGESRRVLVRTLARLAEPLGVIVDGAYDEILSRAPTASQRAQAVARLRGDGDRSALYAALIGTGEFHIRAQGFPNPED